MNNIFKHLMRGMSAVLFSFISSSVLAQIPSQPQLEIDDTNIDDLPDVPQQMKSWYCSKGNQAVEVEVLNVSWQEIIETNGWQCTEQVSAIPDKASQFSCEPAADGTIAIITVTWLEGQGSQQAMQTWMNDLQNKNMDCTVTQANPEWEG